MDFKKLYLLATVIWAAGLAIGSLLPGGSALATEVEQFNFLGFGLHLIGYAIFGLLLVLTLKKYSVKNDFLYTIVIAAAYGLAMEGLQMFVPNRDPSVVDAVANVIGAFISLSVLKIYKVMLEQTPTA